MSTSLSSSKKAHKHDCVVGVEDSSGNVVPFDIQSAEPGAFTMPGASDIETYEPGSMARATWVYFKGNPQEKPKPEHPFEKPFEDLTIFTIDLVRDDDTSKVLREIMREFGLILCHVNTLTRDQHLPLPLSSGYTACRSPKRATTRWTCGHRSINRASTTTSTH